MELAFIAGIVGCIIGCVLGWIGRGHVHDIADKATSAVNRATTISGGDLAALNSKVNGLGDQLQTVLNQINKPVTGAIDKAAGS